MKINNFIAFKIKILMENFGLVLNMLEFYFILIGNLVTK